LSYSTTRSATFGITTARYLTSKIAADLRSMNPLYGKPTFADTDDVAEYATLLLHDGYLDRVDYGLCRRKAAGEWECVKLSGPNNGTPRFTYSDVTQRLVPTAVLTAYPDSPLTAAGLLAAARKTWPTPTCREDRLAHGQHCTLGTP
jgi:hypothetical protein